MYHVALQPKSAFRGGFYVPLYVGEYVESGLQQAKKGLKPGESQCCIRFLPTRRLKRRQSTFLMAPQHAAQMRQGARER